MDNTLEKIYRASIKFLVTLSIEETYELIVKEAMKLLRADYGSILLEEDGGLKRVYASSPNFYKIKPRKRGLTYGVYKTRKPLVLESRGVFGVHPEVKRMGIQSDIIVSLPNKGKSIGVLTLMSKKSNFFTEKEIASLQLFAPLASLSIRKTQLYEETKKALESRDLFISMAAHELRTPLTTISGYTQLLYSKLAGANTPESRWITDLSWETLRMTYLVNELLEIDRIKTGQFQYHFKQFSLGSVLKRAIVDMRITHPEHNVVFKEAAFDDAIIGDFDKMLQVVINILDNAAKYSPPKSEIVVSLKNSPSFVILSITDKGKGIAKKEINKVFDRFYQIEGKSREGMGLGLFLVKNIIKQHRGTIELKSKEKRGTTVTIKLPKIKHE